MQRNPREFVAFVARHYHLLVALSEESRGFQSDDEVAAFIRSHSNSTSPGKIVAEMKRLGILNQSTGEWAPPPFLVRFLGSLQERHILATPAVVQAWVDRLQDLANDFDRLVGAQGTGQQMPDDEAGRSLLHEIGDSIHVVSTTVGDNIERIGQEVAAYRNTEDAAVMRSRLRRLVDLYDNYLVPIMSILDTSGPFQAVAEQVVTLCAQVKAREQSMGVVLADEARRLRQQVTWLRRTVLHQADEATAELAPLCIAATRESTIARGVNRALQAIQDDKWQLLDLENSLMVVSDQDSALAGDDALAGFMQDAFVLRQESPPCIAPTEPGRLALPMSTGDLRSRLEEVDQVDDVLAWIRDACDGDIGADGSVNLLFRLADLEQDRLRSNGQIVEYDYGDVSVETRQWAWSRDNEQ